MRNFTAILVLFFLALFAYVKEARTGPVEYWQDVMQEQPFPKAITDLFFEEDETKSDNEQKPHMPSAGKPFVTDFDTENNIIIYHKGGVVN